MINKIINGAKSSPSVRKGLRTKKKITVMEIIKHRKNLFSAISFNRITAERFRKFSKKNAPSHSETLDDMIDFFELTKISPRNKIMKQHLGLYNYVLSRLDFIVALIREQEEKYHKPTYEMLAGLFKKAEMMEAKKQPMVERKVRKGTLAGSELEDQKVSLDDYNVLKNAREKDREKFNRALTKIIDGIEKVNPTFGKPYNKLNIDISEIDSMKREYI